MIFLKKRPIVQFGDINDTLEKKGTLNEYLRPLEFKHLKDESNR